MVPPAQLLWISQNVMSEPVDAVGRQEGGRLKRFIHVRNIFHSVIVSDCDNKSVNKNLVIATIIHKCNVSAAVLFTLHPFGTCHSS